MFRVKLVSGQFAWIKADMVLFIAPGPELGTCVIQMHSGPGVVAQGIADEVGSWLGQALAGLVPLAQCDTVGN